MRPASRPNRLTLDNTARLSSILAVNSASLTFALGSGATTSPLNFDAPATNSTYMTVLGDTAGEISFTGADTVTIVDLTDGGLLALSLNTPCLLIKAGSDSDYTGLVTSLNGVLSLDGNGYVVGVGSSTAPGSYVPITIAGIGSDGITSPAIPCNGISLYLDNGQLELVPEPGTWALPVFVQRRRNRLS